jgi:hypothetical protein
MNETVDYAANINIYENVVIELNGYSVEWPISIINYHSVCAKYPVTLN